MSTSSSFNSLSPSSPLGEFPSKPSRQQPALPSPGGGLIPDPHTSPHLNGTKRTGLKISFSQPNLRKAGQMNLKFPATGYEAVPEKFSIYSKVGGGSAALEGRQSGRKSAGCLGGRSTEWQ
jgi:hypothetical protein